MPQLPPHLQRFHNRPAAIEAHRRCANCEYDLSGLRTADRCPECATPIGVSLSTDDSLSNAPLAFLRPFSRGCMLFAASAPFLVIFFGLTVSRLALGLTIRFPAAAALLAALGWGIGIYLATIPTHAATTDAPPSSAASSTHWPILRVIVRSTQFCWCACILALMALSAFPTGPSTSATRSFMALAALTFLAAATGLCAVLLYFIRIARWAGDDELADRLRLFPLFVPVSCFIIAAAIIVVPILTGGPITFLLMPLGGIFALFLLYACWTFIRVCWSLGSLGYWATENRQMQLSSSQRRSSRIVERIEENMKRRSGSARATPAAPVAQHLPPPGDGPIDLLDGKDP